MTYTVSSGTLNSTIPYHAAASLARSVIMQTMLYCWVNKLITIPRHFKTEANTMALHTYWSKTRMLPMATTPTNGRWMRGDHIISQVISTGYTLHWSRQLQIGQHWIKYGTTVRVLLSNSEYTIAVYWLCFCIVRRLGHYWKRTARLYRLVSCHMHCPTHTISWMLKY